MTCLGGSSRYKVAGTLTGSIAANWGTGAGLRTDALERGTEGLAGTMARGTAYLHVGQTCTSTLAFCERSASTGTWATIDSRPLTACRLQANSHVAISPRYPLGPAEQSEDGDAARNTQHPISLAILFFFFCPSITPGVCLLSARPHGQIKSKQISSAGRAHIDAMPASGRCAITATLALHFFDPPTAVASQLVREQQMHIRNPMDVRRAVQYRY